MKSLIIVESPTKANTIKKFLGAETSVLSSYGHIRDLPKSTLGVDVEKDFEVKYVIPTKARKNVNLLKKEVEKADTVYVATDPDREGEAIAWHLIEVLKLDKDKYKRISFHEITKPAIEEALKNPTELNLDLADAQQARRVLDRIVGYKLSPFLWKKVMRGLSAGRVQSVAVRLIVDRENEIKNFKPEEYWSITALLEKESKEQFEAILSKKDGKAISKMGIKTKDQGEDIKKELEAAKYSIASIEKKETKRTPLPPFTTSSLQQEGSKKLRYPAKMTMSVAQTLYEKGLITYHRTDSLNLSEQALHSAQNFINNKFGNNYHQLRRFKTKGRAQEAHEAIRPTNIENEPDSLKIEDKYKKLYKLIWNRFVASQMTEAIFDSIKVEVKTDNNYTLQSNGSTLKFDGFLKVYPMKFEEKTLPQLKEEENVDLVNIKPEQHFTQPPARYTEASLIKELEENEIGRPSTYAPIISTIQARNYVEKNKERRFEPTEIGTTVNQILVEHFPQIVDIKFTANMEKELDEIAEGNENWKTILKDFYTPFNENLENKYNEVEKKKEEPVITDKVCPKCGKPLAIKTGRFGKFLACTGFPDCKHTENIEDKTKKTGIICPECNQGEITQKKTKKGKIFYGCPNWPDCNFALWDKPTGEKCPKCGALMVEKGKKIKCSNKNCK
ncbi:MAG TPA: type I DNA topoisomerase [Candidatus Pacearchaeota archaeon]|nr:type I DNA topoisomerase [Candidatus Pacearchaeota archaeon]HPR79878.1 type I DNA topoisomerase [Candidatus Pacearchaeota archaeon]